MQIFVQNANFRTIFKDSIQEFRLGPHFQYPPAPIRLPQAT